MASERPEAVTWVNCGAELAAAAASRPDASGQIVTQQVIISTRGHLRAVPQSDDDRLPPSTDTLVRLRFSLT
jgi:hypothetical protein